jgi:hypothetical protein
MPAWTARTDNVDGGWTGARWSRKVPGGVRSSTDLLWSHGKRGDSPDAGGAQPYLGARKQAPGDGSLTGGAPTSTITLATIDISVADQQFQITMVSGDIGVTAGNTQPVSQVTTKTDIGDSTVTFLSAPADMGMGSYTLDPDFELEVRAEVYAASYSATVTVAIVSGP